MKTRLILATLLLLAFGTAKAQETLIPTPDGDGSKINTIVVKGSGPIVLKQGQKLAINNKNHNLQKYYVVDSILYLEGAGSREVTVQRLDYLTVMGAGNVRTDYGALRGQNLSIRNMGSGSVDLIIGYDNVYVRSTGSGDVKLSGNCQVFCGEALGSGRVNAERLNYDAKVEKSGDQWNMAFNLDDDPNGLKKDFLKGMVQNAQPFFETETNRKWFFNKNEMQASVGNPDMPELSPDLSELMRELGENLQQLSDSVDWEQFERDMEQWGAEMEKWGRKMERWGEHFEDKYGRSHERHHDQPSCCPTPPTNDGPADKRPQKKSLLLDPHWNGFEAGLNMLFNTPADVVNANNGAQGMELRPLRSWYFGFNIADVGIAFDRRHRTGLFTGVGIGWNNFSWNNDITIEYDPDNVVYTLVPIESDQVVKNSKHGALFLQVPLMFQVRPTHHMYIDAGVTGGLRIAQWNRVKLEDGTQTKRYYGANINQFKLDASLRVGAENLGFFANYALLPIFTMTNIEVHPVNFGFSINF
ncbi:MAG: DUF2807 domain-containing protein [Bacteroidales bacterium]|nr:DUF2807 domain-containing protein [Bacteroidales bacterium]